jgi:hypothetical protein
MRYLARTACAWRHASSLVLVLLHHPPAESAGRASGRHGRSRQHWQRRARRGMRPGGGAANIAYCKLESISNSNIAYCKLEYQNISNSAIFCAQGDAAGGRCGGPAEGPGPVCPHEMARPVLLHRHTVSPPPPAPLRHCIQAHIHPPGPRLIRSRCLTRKRLDSSNQTAGTLYSMPHPQPEHKLACSLQHLKILPLLHCARPPPPASPPSSSRVPLHIMPGISSFPSLPAAASWRASWRAGCPKPTVGRI